MTFKASNIYCPNCGDKYEGAYIVSTFTTELFWESFKDELGQIHYHNPNVTTIKYKCDNDHEWEENKKHYCWCGWPDGEIKDDKLGCPICGSNNFECIKSWSLTKFDPIKFEDKNGKSHTHDPNLITKTFKCECGNIWDYSEREMCWCGWPN